MGLALYLIRAQRPAKKLLCTNACAASIFEIHERGQTFNQNFSIASLAFLASWILGATERRGAAAVTQHTYCQSRDRRGLRQRFRLFEASS